MRQLGWGQVPNIRDLGGLPTPHGPTQFGRIARGPRRELMDDGAWNAATTWGLNTIVDLRCSYEIGRHDDDPVLTTPPPVTVVHAPTEDHDNAEFRETCFPILDSPAYWAHNIRILPDLVRHSLEAIAEATRVILVHCSAGRDRTGLVTALLLANTGVAPHLIADDYELSVRAMAGTPSHQPTHDRQAQWTPEQLDLWAAQTHPIVAQFAMDVPAHFATTRLSEATQARLHSLLVDPS